MTIPELQQYADELKHAWRLAHWRITVVEQPKTDEHLCGSITWSIEYRTATVSIDTSKPDLKGTMKHELLHLRLEGHKPNPGRYDPHYEHALNVLSEVI